MADSRNGGRKSSMCCYFVVRVRDVVKKFTFAVSSRDELLELLVLSLIAVVAHSQCSNGTGTPFRSFKTTRLIVKLHQAYVLGSVYVTPFYFESFCNSLQEIWNKNFAVGGIVQWHDPTFLKKLVWSINNHFFAFFNSS